MINSSENGPAIKREQVKQRPDLTDDTQQHQREEARFGLSIPIMIGLVSLIFIAAIMIAIAVI